MKKSEMVKIIHLEIKCACPEYAQMWDDDELATRVLDAIEEAGMQYCEKEFPHTCLGWEPEDE